MYISSIPIFTINSKFSGDSPIKLNILSTNLGTIPFNFSSRRTPYIVNVLPEDV